LVGRSNIHFHHILLGGDRWEYSTTTSGDYCKTADSHSSLLDEAVALRPDSKRVRALLVAAFVEHVHDLWPAGVGRARRDG
jgi:hypothetical protein